MPAHSLDKPPGALYDAVQACFAQLSRADTAIQWRLELNGLTSPVSYRPRSTGRLVDILDVRMPDRGETVPLADNLWAKNRSHVQRHGNAQLAAYAKGLCRERQKKTRQPVKAAGEFAAIWCRRSESNRHGHEARWILSPVRLPVSPLRRQRLTLFIHSLLVAVNNFPCHPQNRRCASKRARSYDKQRRGIPLHL